MSYTDIPQELRDLRQWGLYHRIWQPSKNKYTKVPVDPYSGGAGKSNDSSTWSDFATASNAMEHFANADGLAFYFANGYFGIDIDHIKSDVDAFIEGDRDNNIVDEFVISTQSYTERSMSGEGIHIIAKGNLPDGQRRHNNFEMYDNGRFFALTGDTITKSESIMKVPDEVIGRLHRKYFMKASKIDADLGVVDNTVTERIDTPALLEMMYESSSGVRIKHLINGGWENDYASQSEADLALANYLSFWTGRDFAQMDEIFRDSVLFRDKYNEKRGQTTYGIALLTKAISEQTDVYHGKNLKPLIDLEDLPTFLTGNAEIVAEQDDSPKQKFFSYDDTGLAERFKYYYGDNFLYDTIARKSMYYDGQVWQEDNYRLLEKTMNKTVDRIKEEPEFTIAPENMGDSNKTPDELKAAFKKKSRSHSAKENAIKELRNLITVTTDDFDKELSVLNTPSGVLELTSGAVKESTHEDRFTKITNAEYNDKKAPERWLAFLEQTFKGNEELIEFTQRALGYAATGTMDEEVMFILHGNGKNGKSVFMNTIDYVLGDYSINVDPETVFASRSRNSGGPSGDIARMKGARLMVLSEPEEGKPLAEGLVKKITSKDTITARKLHSNEIEFRPTGTIFMMTNHKPIINGTDDGIWRRLIFIPFRNQVKAENMDKKLEDKLRTEADAILAWIQEGTMKWQRDGLNPPPVVLNETNEYRDEMDDVQAFIEEYFDYSKDDRTEFKEIATRFDTWKRLHGVDMTNKKLGRELGTKFEKKRSHGKVYYYGISLKMEEIARGVKLDDLGY
ncbi:phage/plasmid primase, P4 family [Leuconostoc falkenbergense]|uniref:phage/plasmid primase, P4 family n=2 Tax=Leuconostoc falkenbergense TaxID=2766470 RepID=UPI000461D069|nr:DNA primase/helicase, phage-associated [Leuconostoc pseudomesenteroides 1159]KDA50482.1 DNA primase/helicase, phage-associated [Leuconostoc pseudomesenteroides PS12]ORI49839.1 DNA primase [Leuconostoc pseudomesenteroides]ORI51620.1 DNA primase [Leuconostoc pseudomesenteroides]ORI54886.1 DNA primase [Leuconostoc pseudomesenteroides]